MDFYGYSKVVHGIKIADHCFNHSLIVNSETIQNHSHQFLIKKRNKKSGPLSIFPHVHIL